VNSQFAELVNSLEPRFAELLALPPVTYASLPRSLPQRAIYLFSRGSEHLYVGRTNNLRRRLRGHCSPGSRHFSAVFAFKIARIESGRITPSYKKEGSRASLAEDPVFKPIFVDAKKRIAGMDIRYVGENDPVRQALLEIYVATALGTPYNDFDNH
jgi:hypothetical protein